jgi:hypothetical protein
MAELAKWAWIILLVVIWLGPWIFAIVAVDIIIFCLIVWLKPEWLEKL